MAARSAAALLLLALLVAHPARAQVEDAPDAPEAAVRARVVLPHALSEALEVELSADGPAEVELPNGTLAKLAPDRPHRYVVEVARPSRMFLVLRAEDALPARVSLVTLEPPGGWRGLHTPGVLVFGQDMRVTRHEAGNGAHARIAMIGEPLSEDLVYLDLGLAYLRAQHAGAPAEIVVVRTPPDALAQGFAAGAAVVLPASASTAELAHLVARAHQQYRVVEVAPTSAAWFREGEERLHAQMSLMAAKLRTAAELDDAFTRARAVADPDEPLPQAPAGSTLARQKGLVVVRALDAEIRNATNGTAALADLLAAIGGTEGRLDSAALEQAAVALAGPTLADFFARYVYGSDWPRTAGVRDAADLFLLSFALEDASVAEGDAVRARYEAVNRGTQPSETELVLRLDDAIARTVRVRLDVGERASDVFTFTARGRGGHVVALGPFHETLHVRGPAQLTLAAASSVPEQPAAGEPFVLLVYIENAGETSGRARVEVYEDERLVQRTTETVVDARTTDALTLPLRVDEPGLHAYEVRLVAEGANATLAHTIDVQLAQRQDVPMPGVLALGAAIVLARLAPRPRQAQDEA